MKKTINQNHNNPIINAIFQYEQEKSPYYNIIEIDVCSANENLIEYRTLICSKYDTKWRIWSGHKRINIVELIRHIRNEKIDSVLS